jgi:hypothetical protein
MRIRFEILIKLLTVTAVAIAVSTGTHCLYLLWGGAVGGNRPTASLRCANRDIDLKAFWLTDNISVVFHLVNDHPSKTVRVSRFLATCLCTKIDPNSLVLPPGKEAKVHVDIDLSKAFKPEAAGNQKLRERVIALVSNDSDRDGIVSMTVYGTAQPSLVIGTPRHCPSGRPSGQMS